MHPTPHLTRLTWPAVQHAVWRAWSRRATADRWPAWSATALESLARLIYHRQKQHPLAAPYAWPSEQWLADRCNVARETIARHLHQWVRAGFLRVIHRRKINGKWQTNVYLTGSYLAAILRSAINAGRRPAPDHGTAAAILTPKEQASVTTTSHGGELDTLITRWLSRAPSPKPHEEDPHGP